MNGLGESTVRDGWPERVGFVGLGTMGGPMARRLVAAGYDTAVYDIVAERVNALEAVGARAARSPREVAAASDLVITMLPDSGDVLAALGGADGLSEGLRAGTVLVDMSTISPTVTREVAKQVESRGAAMVDAPVGRTSRHAEEGDLLIMIGGDEAVVARVEPVLAHFGHDRVRCGPIGSGETMKLVNNLLTATIVAANAEALVLGVSAGLELSTILNVLRSTAASNTHLRVTYAEKALRRDFSPGFATRLAAKDLRLAVSLAAEQQLPVALGAAAWQMFNTACREGHGGDDYTSVLTVLERLAGLELKEQAEANEQAVAG